MLVTLNDESQDEILKGDHSINAFEQNTLQCFSFFFLFDAVKNEIWFCSISQLSVKNSHLLFVSLRNGTIRFSSGTRPIMAV